MTDDYPPTTGLLMERLFQAAARDRREPRIQCYGKHRYGTRERAEGIIALLEPPRKPESFSSYLCPWCGLWHIGHDPRKMREGVAVAKRKDKK